MVILGHLAAQPDGHQRHIAVQRVLRQAAFGRSLARGSIQKTGQFRDRATFAQAQLARRLGQAHFGADRDRGHQPDALAAQLQREQFARRHKDRIVRADTAPCAVQQQPTLSARGPDQKVLGQVMHQRPAPVVRPACSGERGDTDGIKGHGAIYTCLFDNCNISGGYP